MFIIMANDIQTYIRIVASEGDMERLCDAVDGIVTGCTPDVPSAEARYTLGDLVERLGGDRCAVDDQGWSEIAYVEREHDCVWLHVVTPWGNTSAFRRSIQSSFPSSFVCEETD